MVEVLEPFEERHGDTTGVDVKIGNDEDVAVEENLIGSWCGWSVGSFSDDLSLNLVCVITVDDFFNGSGNENVAFFEHEVFSVVWLKSFR